MPQSLSLNWTSPVPMPRFSASAIILVITAGAAAPEYSPESTSVP